MTNYNERLDEILETVIAEAFIFGNFAFGKGVDVRLPDDNHELPPKEKAKQALTSLIKELVAEAKPYRETIIDKWNKDRVDEVKATNAAMNAWADIYEQNLLKALSNSANE